MTNNDQSRTCVAGEPNDKERALGSSEGLAGDADWKLDEVALASVLAKLKKAH